MEGCVFQRRQQKTEEGLLLRSWPWWFCGNHGGLPSSRVNYKNGHHHSSLAIYKWRVGAGYSCLAWWWCMGGSSYDSLQSSAVFSPQLLSAKLGLALDWGDIKKNQLPGTIHIFTMENQSSIVCYEHHYIYFCFLSNSLLSPPSLPPLSRLSPLFLPLSLSVSHSVSPFSLSLALTLSPSQLKFRFMFHTHNMRNMKTVGNNKNIF